MQSSLKSKTSSNVYINFEFKHLLSLFAKYSTGFKISSELTKLLGISCNKDDGK